MIVGSLFAMMRMCWQMFFVDCWKTVSELGWLVSYDLVTFVAGVGSIVVRASVTASRIKLMGLISYSSCSDEVSETWIGSTSTSFLAVLSSTSWFVHSFTGGTPQQLSDREVDLCAQFWVDKTHKTQYRLLATPVISDFFWPKKGGRY